MAEQTQAAAEISKATEDSRKQSDQLARAMAEQSRALRDMTIAAQNISKQIGMITRANREHSAVAETVLGSLHEIRQITSRNATGAKDTLRGTQHLMQSAEELTATIGDKAPNGNGVRNGKRR